MTFHGPLILSIRFLKLLRFLLGTGVYFLCVMLTFLVKSIKFISNVTPIMLPLVYPVFKKDRILIDRPLHKFSKYIGTLSTLSFSKRLFALNLWDHKIRTIYRDMVDVFKILNNVYDIDNYQIFKLSHNCSTRGHTKKLYKEKFRLTNTNLFFT